MRLSCNFVNVYTIVYRVQYTCRRVNARNPNGHPREDCRENIGVSLNLPYKNNFRKSRVGRVGEDPREDARVGVGVVEFQLK